MHYAKNRHCCIIFELNKQIFVEDGKRLEISDLDRRGISLAADLRLVFTYAKCRFSHDVAQFILSVFHETVLCRYVDIMHRKNSLSGRE